MLFISIPKPCNENWNDMSPRDQGAFCSVCSKTVIDFTVLSDEEVKNYFFQHREQKTCGRFRNDQLADIDNPLPQLLADAIPFWKKFLAIVFILFGTFLSGCKRPLKEQAVIPQTSKDEFEKKIFEKESASVDYIMPEITEIIQMGEPDIDVCTVTKGYTIPKIIPDTSIISEGIIGDIEPPSTDIFAGNVIIQDTSKIVKPDSLKSDTLRKKVFDKNGCEVTKADSTNFIMP
jgi:hypothetical protein